jgi:hypothetical protein
VAKPHSGQRNRSSGTVKVPPVGPSSVEAPGSESRLSSSAVASSSARGSSPVSEVDASAASSPPWTTSSAVSVSTVASSAVSSSGHSPGSRSGVSSSPRISASSSAGSSGGSYSSRSSDPAAASAPAGGRVRVHRPRRRRGLVVDAHVVRFDDRGDLLVLGDDARLVAPRAVFHLADDRDDLVAPLLAVPLDLGVVERVPEQRTFHSHRFTVSPCGT